MPALEYWLWLSAEINVTAAAKARLLDRYGGAEEAFFAPPGDYAHVAGLSQAEAALLERRDLSRARRAGDACAAQGVGIVTMQDAAYPKRLKHIYAPPPVLYVKGTLPDVDANALIAVIGTRQATPYGLKMGRDIAWQIARGGGIVVSGLTSGIDAQAARGALLAGGRCVAVLGTPHEMENGSLARDVAACGAVLSEYPPGTPFRRSFFRERNRVSAGLSVGVVVVEAPAKSGARLFAEEAADQGKEIFAVPGNADAENCAGTLALLKEGAKLVTDGWEVLSEFAPLYPEKLRPDRQEKPPEEPAAAPAPKKPRPGRAEPGSDKKSVDKKKEAGYIDWKDQLASLTEDQLKIIAAIDKNASHIDDIIENTGLPAATVLAQLTLLEIRGFVRREAGRRVALKTSRK